jgi:glycosyltransferase involved in cell wall biosynthesis
MARMEPENNVEMIIQGWMASGKEKNLVLVGNTNNKFGTYLTENYQHEKVRYLGAIYDQPVVNALRHYSSLYFHGHSVGGTNPSLLEAMACGCAIAAHDNVFNRAVLEQDAFYFTDAGDVSKMLDADPADSVVRSYREHNLEKLARYYVWEKIIDEYEKIFLHH